MKNYIKVEHMKFSLSMLVLLLSMVIMVMLSGCSNKDTFTISGTISSGGYALSGVTVALSGDASRVVTTDRNGYYSFDVSNYSFYNVTPSLPGYTFSPSSRPVHIVGISGGGFNFSGDVISGATHTVYLRSSDATVWAWGNNSNGQLGNGNTTPSKIPAQISSLSGLVTDLVAGNEYTVALKNDGTVWAWGKNSNGQLGNNSATDNYNPVQVSGTSGLPWVIDIAAGSAHTVALDIFGTVWTWGSNSYGQLGNNSTTNSPIPVSLSTYLFVPVIAIAAGYDHTVVLDSSGTVWTWGHNNNGQLGNNTVTDSLIPVSLNTYLPATVIAIAAGYEDTVAVDSVGTVWTWGYNAYGQLGNNSIVNSPIPVSLSTYLPATVTAVAAGTDHTVALDSSGTVWTWGHNNKSQLGNNSVVDSLIPVSLSTYLPPGTVVTAILAGYEDTFALDSIGTVWMWGYNFYGQLGNNSTTDSPIPVQAQFP